MMFLTIGKSISVNEVPSGIKPTIVEYFLAKQEIITEKTVVEDLQVINGAENFAPFIAESKRTVPYQKYSYPTKYPCSDCAIYRLNIQVETKMVIEIYR